MFESLALAALLAQAAEAETRARLPASETLHYRVEWRLIHAGNARLEWAADARHGWQGKLHLESAGLVSKLYKVNDNYTALLGPGLCAISTHILAQEGQRHRETSVTFDAEAGKASYLEKDLVKNHVVEQKEIDIPACVHDVVGGLYFLRTLHLEPGRSAQVPMSDGKKSVAAKVEAQAREEVETPAGKFKTIRYEAFVFNNVLYRRPAHLLVWLTDDERRLPVQIRVRMRFTIGTITLQLTKRSGQDSVEPLLVW